MYVCVCSTQISKNLYAEDCINSGQFRRKVGFTLAGGEVGREHRSQASPTKNKEKCFFIYRKHVYDHIYVFM